MPPAATVHPTIPASRRPPAQAGGARRACGTGCGGRCGTPRPRCSATSRYGCAGSWSSPNGRISSTTASGPRWPRPGTRDWYLGIADHGYTGSLGIRFNSNNLAFFPLYPALIKTVAGVTPGSRATVGLLIAIGFSFVAAWGVFAVGDRLYGRRVGTVLTVLWGVLPVAIVQWMGYTESMFTAFAAWALYAALTGRWVWAGSLAVLAGLTRPTGIAVAVAVSVAALPAVFRGDRRALAGALIAPLGWLGYVAWVGQRVGRVDGYFAVQKLWRNEWDGGATTLREVRQLLVYMTRPQLFLVVVSLMLIVSVVLYLLCLADRQPLALLVFTGVLLAVALGSSGVYFPRTRFLLPGFPLLLPIALALARARRTAVAAVVLGTATLSSAWLGAYMLLVWRGPP